MYIDNKYNLRRQQIQPTYTTNTIYVYNKYNLRIQQIQPTYTTNIIYVGDDYMIYVGNNIIYVDDNIIYVDNETLSGWRSLELYDVTKYRFKISV